MRLILPVLGDLWEGKYKMPRAGLLIPYGGNQ
jgi:hypothetical protein